MYITSLRYYNFRNISDLTFEPDAGFNVICGDNGQGKTNLLEGIYLLAMPKSFRKGGISDWIREDQSEASIQCGFFDGKEALQVEMFMEDGHRSFALNGKKTRNVGEISDRMKLVFFGPDDLNIVKGGPQERRRFLDKAIYAYDPGYLGVMQDYLEVVKNRNSVIKDYVLGRLPNGLMESYDEMLVRLGLKICTARLEFLSFFAPEFEAFCGEFFEHENRKIRLKYLQTFGGDEDRTEPDSILEFIARNRAAELGRMCTMFGPHLDDLEILMNGQPARTRASQGQARTISAALRAAELLVWKKRRQEAPVLLLDDLPSELDDHHHRMVMRAMENEAGQVLLTTTSPESVIENRPVKVFFMSNGNLVSGGADKHGRMRRKKS